MVALTRSTALRIHVQVEAVCCSPVAAMVPMASTGMRPLMVSPSSKNGNFGSPAKSSGVNTVLTKLVYGSTWSPGPKWNSFSRRKNQPTAPPFLHALALLHSTARGVQAHTSTLAEKGLQGEAAKRNEIQGRGRQKQVNKQKKLRGFLSRGLRLRIWHQTRLPSYGEHWYRIERL